MSCLMKVVPLSVGLTFKTILGSRRGFLVKFLLNLPMLVIIGCLTLSLRREEVLAHRVIRQNLESVARSTMVIAFLGLTISYGVAKVATRLRIELI